MTDSIYLYKIKNNSKSLSLNSKKLISYCARPELVEGFLRALGDILQQVQDERGLKTSLGIGSNYNSFNIIQFIT